VKVALIPCAFSDWRQQGRLLGRVELTPSLGAQAQYEAWGAQLRSAGLSRIFHAPDELSRDTALFIGRFLNVPAKALDSLTEVDLGLWAGLTETELKQRYPKAHRQLLESPLNVSPPGGEEFGAAVARLRATLRKRIKPNGREHLGLVLRPLTLAMARYLLQGAPPHSIWETSQRAAEPIVVDCQNLLLPAETA